MDGNQKSNTFANVSMIIGILSIATFFTGIIPYPLAALGILFALLSRHKGKRLDSYAKTGIITSIIGMCVATVVLINVILSIPTYLGNKEYREYLNRVCEQANGQSFDDMMKESFGIDLDEYFPLDSNQ